MSASQAEILSYTSEPISRPAPAAERFTDWAGKHRKWLLGALLILYLAGFTGRWRIEPDAALYLSVAQNIAEGKGFTYQGRPHNLVGSPGTELEFAL